MVDRDRLEALGIAPEFPDAFGTWHHLGDSDAEALIRAMDLPPDHWAAPDTSDAVVFTRPDRPAALAVGGELACEDGTTRRVDGALPADLPLGYHRLHRDDGVESNVVSSPGRCHRPDLRVWGWAVQLYSARSRASWGVGDLADLRALGAWSRGRGAGTLLVNPLDAVTPIGPRETSPYFPSSRRFRDPLYLRVEEVPGAEAVAAELEPLARLGRALDEDRTIDRDLVFATKLRALERIWSHAPTAGEEDGYVAYCKEQGRALTEFAVFCALAEVYGTGWRGWPQRYRHPGNDAVVRFAEAHADRVAFHAWVQWCCDEQLRTAGESIPLMRDLPIGFDPDGADAWAWQDLLADGVTVGAPPDPLGPDGQDWLLPAFVPWKLRRAAYEPVVQTLRAAFRHAGALRIDHVLGLFRLYWIPPGGSATGGTYVRQPADELLDILALESHRAGAFVVGEDLGTVEPGVRDRLAERDLLRYRVLWFEEQPPREWSAGALASVTTHDLPTVAGLWSGADLDLQRRLGLDPDDGRYWAMRDKLAAWTGLPHDAPPETAVVEAHRVLAASPTAVVVAQLEDALAVRERINVPGTTRETHANWSLALPVAIEALDGHPTVERVVAALNDGRG